MYISVFSSRCLYFCVCVCICLFCYKYLLLIMLNLNQSLAHSLPLHSVRVCASLSLCVWVVNFCCVKQNYSVFIGAWGVEHACIEWYGDAYWWRDTTQAAHIFSIIQINLTQFLHHWNVTHWFRSELFCENSALFLCVNSFSSLSWNKSNLNSFMNIDIFWITSFEFSYRLTSESVFVIPFRWSHWKLNTFASTKKKKRKFLNFRVKAAIKAAIFSHFQFASVFSNNGIASLEYGNQSFTGEHRTWNRTNDKKIEKITQTMRPLIWS